MKIRYGFVSNSSSSSFICDVCGNNVSGMDLCLDEAGMLECVQGHVFCKDHKLNGEVDEDIDVYSVPIELCPICQFKNLAESDGYSYLKTKFSLTDQQILDEIKSAFKSYKDFVKFCASV